MTYGPSYKAGQTLYSTIVQTTKHRRKTWKQGRIYHSGDSGSIEFVGTLSPTFMNFLFRNYRSTIYRSIKLMQRCVS